MIRPEIRPFVGEHHAPRRVTTAVVDVPVPGTDAVVAFNGYYIGERRRVNGGLVDGAFVSSLSVTRRTSTTPRPYRRSPA